MHTNAEYFDVIKIHTWLTGCLVSGGSSLVDTKSVFLVN